LEVQGTNGSLATFLWSFVPEGKPLQNECQTSRDVPTT
jgi:3-methyladenine DNA glycosylase Tag